MKIKARFDTFSKGKKYIKIPIQIDLKDSKEILNYIGNFVDKPLSIDFSIDETEIKKESIMITHEMRAKIFAICADYAKFNGYEKEYARQELTELFCEENQIQKFSLSNVEKDIAKQFISWLIEKSIEFGFISNSIINYSSDFSTAIRISVEKKICIICSNPISINDIHHIDAIGMGRNRNNYDDSCHRKIGLCRKHHIEIEQIGLVAFCKKYHFEELLRKE